MFKIYDDYIEVPEHLSTTLWLGGFIVYTLCWMPFVAAVLWMWRVW